MADIDAAARSGWRCVIGLLGSGRKIDGRKMAAGGGIGACMACSFFCPRFFCQLELVAENGDTRAENGRTGTPSFAFCPHNG
jgi:hypothetical protein